MRNLFKDNFPLLNEIENNNGVITLDDYITYIKTEDKWAVYYKDGSGLNKNPVVSAFGLLRPISINKLAEIFDCKIKRLTCKGYNVWFALQKEGMLFIGGLSYHGCGNWMVQFESNSNKNWILTKYFPNIAKINEVYIETDKLKALIPMHRDAKGKTLNDYIADYFLPANKATALVRNHLIQKLKIFMYNRLIEIKNNKVTIVYDLKVGRKKSSMKGAESIEPMLTTEEAIAFSNSMVMDYVEENNKDNSNEPKPQPKKITEIPNPNDDIGVTNEEVMAYMNSNSPVNVNSFFDEED